MYRNKNINNKKSRLIDNIRINTYETEFPSLYNSVIAEAGTTGHRGGSSKKGGRTFLKLLAFDDADIHVQKDASGKGFSIKAGGDIELDILIEALEFILNTLKEERKNNGYTFNIPNNSKNCKTISKSVDKSDTAFATKKQYDYLKQLALNHNLILNTSEITKNDANELIKLFKENKDIELPKQYSNMFKVKFK